jgi:hypothetical protein
MAVSSKVDGHLESQVSPTPSPSWGYPTRWLYQPCGPKSGKAPTGRLVPGIARQARRDEIDDCILSLWQHTAENQKSKSKACLNGSFLRRDLSLAPSSIALPIPHPNPLEADALTLRWLSAFGSLGQG